MSITTTTRHEAICDECGRRFEAVRGDVHPASFKRASHRNSANEPFIDVYVCSWACATDSCRRAATFAGDK